MQVRKFEARSMKEALEMVKVQLGPDAIILGVKDNKRSYGLVGDGSIEITAAVSDETLNKKKFAESRMREQDRTKLQNGSARSQKEYINKTVNNYNTERQPKPAPRPLTRTPYINIADEEMQMMEQEFSNPMNSSGPANEVNALKNEIATLKKVIKDFQAIPQNIHQGPAITMHPGADHGLSYEVSATFDKLVQAGVSHELAAEILMQAQKDMPPAKLRNKALVDAFAAKFILDTTKVVNEKVRSKFHYFIGPSGGGKTSSLIKLASHLVVNEKKRIAILTTDTQKVGASEQMRIYAQILNVPFGMIRNAGDWQSMLAQTAQLDYILVDSPGLSLKSMEENALMREIMPPASTPVAIHLVLEATAKDSDISEIGKRYKAYGYQDIIFTSLDLSVQHGTIYNFMRRFEVPLHSFGVGPRVPEDYEVATKERVLDLIFKLTSINGSRGKA
jgi:flagellar biosynthesis protein FlhF